jgi:hypothetical protein
MPQTPTTVRNLIGCNMSFRREVFGVVGGFRDGIGRVGTRPVGCEETELCIRVNQRWSNKKLLYDPAAQVYHRVPANRGTWHYFLTRCFSEGLSKALVAQLVGSKDGLSNERTYTFRTLPLGVLRGSIDALRLDLNGLRRAASIVGGLAFTTAGYLKGRLSRLSVATQIEYTTSDVVRENLTT